MMRRAVALVVLALASVSFAQVTDEAIAICGPTPALQSGHSLDSGFTCVKQGVQNQNFWAYFSSNATQSYHKPPWSSTECPDGVGMAAFSHTDKGTQMSMWSTALQSCRDSGAYSEPEPEMPYTSDGWIVTEFPECDGIFGMRYIFEEDTLVGYDVSWSTKYGGAWSGFMLDEAEYDAAVAAFEAACGEPVPDKYDPLAPDDPSVACTGLDGIACEATLQDVRHILGLILRGQQDDRDDAAAPPFPDADIGMGTEEPPFQPPFDNSQPGWEEWRAPEVDVGELEALVLLINTRADEVMAAGAGRLPFGLIGWVPEATIEAAPACVNPSWTILRTTEEIGWCDSAPEAWLAGTGRALSLILATFAFGFAVVRTVAWA